ncbi:histidine kinase [Desmonostoc muscorum CCALA 125]|nr:histidine kinase [Desmonostoc muscorum CCALA 125]
MGDEGDEGVWGDYKKASHTYDAQCPMPNAPFPIPHSPLPIPYSLS